MLNSSLSVAVPVLPSGLPADMFRYGRDLAIQSFSQRQDKQPNAYMDHKARNLAYTHDLANYY